MAHTDLPTLQILQGHDRRYRSGYPWIYSNELRMDPAARALAPGDIVRIADRNNVVLGVGYFNPHSLIAFRSLTRNPAEAIDAAFFRQRLERALALRQRFFDLPFYRLIHAEADGFPGLIVDRFDKKLVAQVSTAGMEWLFPLIEQAMIDVLAPEAIVLHNDQAARSQETLDSYVRVVRGAITGPVQVEEGGVTFLADLLAGQKTGWFFDLAPARAMVARLAKGRSLLDLYSHSGAFALSAAKAGADTVLAIDRSELALDLARRAAEQNGLAAKIQFSAGDVFEAAERLRDQGKSYDIVVADPPSFVKSRKELAAGLKGYRKLARLAASLVAPDGFLFIASCSHHVGAEEFASEIAAGVGQTTRPARIVAAGGAGPDHPLHPALAESVYLKWQILNIGER